MEKREEVEVEVEDRGLERPGVDAWDRVCIFVCNV